MDLTPVPGVVDPFDGDPRWVPGWTAKGHPGYMGWAWYRLRVPVEERPGERMAVNAPLEADDAYQLFANGTHIGSLGKFDPQGKIVATYFPIPELLLVPPAPVPAEVAVETTRSLTFAYRVWMGPVGMTYSVAPGGLHYAPLLVAAGSMAAQSKLDWNEYTVENIYPCFEGLVFLLLAMLAASVLLFDRSDMVYFWVAGALMITVANDALNLLMHVPHLLDARVFFLILYAVLYPILLGAWAMVWWVWFQLKRPAWAPKAILGLTLGSMAADAAASAFSFRYLPHAVWSAFEAAGLVVRVALLLLLLLIVALGIRKESKEGWLVLPAALAMVYGLFGPELSELGVGYVFHPFGIMFFLSSLGGLFLVAALGVLMLRRLRHSLERQRQMALDVKQAQEVQQVIVPEARSSFPGLEIESEYRPAREVGGDFFQIIPNKSDGSLLIVAGDVTGKGLQAGMLVALLVGAIRTAARSHPDPLAVLKELNLSLLGRSDAQATCLALRIAKDGSATLANAGHIAPYLNGEPVAMEGALPLGMIEAADFSVMHFQLKQRDKLMLMSDGIAEATDANGALFGFERIHDLLRTTCSAATVAAAAQTFGQEDDISVISVTRTAALQPV
ncbi:MAG TPA: PP2C family protein-serine/threonine phosphatase [Terracidiphilus sp.]|nr:PP2C family protein-serine/threonine phosphatase [Terracidiphilus sp.]